MFGRGRVKGYMQQHIFRKRRQQYSWLLYIKNVFFQLSLKKKFLNEVS